MRNIGAGYSVLYAVRPGPPDIVKETALPHKLGVNRDLGVRCELERLFRNHRAVRNDIRSAACIHEYFYFCIVHSALNNTTLTANFNNFGT